MRGMDRGSWVQLLGLGAGLALLGGAAAGCATTTTGTGTGGGKAATQDGNLQVTVLAAATETPSNVAVHISVGNKAGHPVLGLKPANFRIFEDGKLVPEDKAKRALLDTKVAEAHFTVLLVDLSGPIVESADFPELVNQISRFMERVKPTHQLTVSLFDGRDDLRTVLEPDETDIQASLARIRRYRPEDRKGNLNGAVLKGLAALDRQMAASDAIQKSGNLVIFTDRGDLAAKVPEEELDVALDKTPADVYVIAAGPGVKKPELGKIARTDAFYSDTAKDMATGFGQLAKHLEDTSEGHYLISYCSPKRKGQHQVEIEIVTETQHGKLTHKFSAEGFKKGCTPKQRPAFAEKSPEKVPADSEAGASEAPAGEPDAPGKEEGKQDRKHEGKQDKEAKSE
jgi:hypothetical protein